MSGYGCKNSWENGFRNFMRNSRVAREETIDAYIRYLEILEDRFERSVIELAGNDERMNETIAQIERVESWSEKTKGNYRTAINRLNSYLVSDGFVSGTKSTCGDTSAAMTSKSLRCMKELKSQVIEDDEYSLLSKVNEIEKMTREQEDKTWSSVFMFISGYTLAVPPIVANIGNGGMGYMGILLVSLASVFALAGVVLFIPVLRRPSRQLREIQDYVEKLHFDGKQSGCIHPVDWTTKEKLSGCMSAFALIMSIMSICFSKVV